MKVAIFGATSAIAQSAAKAMLSQNDDSLSFVLVARNKSRLESIANDLKVCGAEQVDIVEQDLSLLDDLEGCVQSIWESSGALDVALIAHGVLPDQAAVEKNWPDIKACYDANGLSYIALMTSLANHMEAKSAGTIAVISSVAGDRGRKSNYVYGSAKGAVSLFAQGLRNRLDQANVHILTVKPGLVDSPMTVDFDKGGPLWSTPDKVGELIAKGIQKKRNVIYVPGFWFVVMTIIKLIPERIFKKLSI